jgi:hypothetical protein
LSHPLEYQWRMNPSSRTMKKTKCSVPLALTWSHAGITYRVTPWPDVQFERLYGDEWIPVAPTESALASAAQTCGEREWSAYLEFVPLAVRVVLKRFVFTRMEALQVVARCPALLQTLDETPALTAFLAAHVTLRGVEAPAWGEINATFERSGIFGLLEWLGLPASRQTIAILSHLSDPDVPKRLLEPVRTMLWEPRTIFALQKIPAITDRQLARYCHALAA